MRIVKHIIILAFTLTIAFQSIAQLPLQNTTREEYIEKYKEIAIQKMQQYGIPASITLAQGLLESNDGNSILATKGKNHFGIKCHKEWQGKKIYYDDDKKHECFRKYKTVNESFNDHSEFLTNRSRYAFLFQLDKTDYKAWAKGLKKAGYATNPKYPQLLIKIIEDNKLYDFDKIALNQKPNISPVISPTLNGRYASSYIFPAPSSYRKTRDLASGRKVYLNNGVELVFVEQGDSFLKLAMEVHIDMGKLQKYNDMGDSDLLYSGQMLYLNKKKRKATQKYHKALENESLYSISQRYGIRLKSLLWKNREKTNRQPTQGTTIWLKKRRPASK
ncbi:MAG: glucosaminidase domain-containing protein [Bacteroidales bacterium]|nr:glucosaminidase domain-containing protein [Bacteroidales bacterium]